MLMSLPLWTYLLILDTEDLTIKILNGLDDSYKELSNPIQAHETFISFEELHEKLINHEA